MNSATVSIALRAVVVQDIELIKKPMGKCNKGLVKDDQDFML